MTSLDVTRIWPKNTKYVYHIVSNMSERATKPNKQLTRRVAWSSHKRLMLNGWPPLLGWPKELRPKDRRLWLLAPCISKWCDMAWVMHHGTYRIFMVRVFQLLISNTSQWISSAFPMTRLNGQDMLKWMSFKRAIGHSFMTHTSSPHLKRKIMLAWWASLDTNIDL